MKINTISPLVGLARYESWKSEWGGGDKLDELSYVSNKCNPEDVLLSCKLFFPDFVVVENGVFLDGRCSSGVFDSWFEKFNGDLQAIEKLINHTHLYDVFDGCSEDVDDVIFKQLADVVALSWRLVLGDKFPERNFNVDIYDSDQEYGPVVTFYQVS